ncbi:agmatinase [Scatolibacter rhodanostii]|uniref:agmatinase n=1 Tax=Scatolibacter rhodanostii TaxID=2014781 RepID=UPI000C078745|nr:agmatinase [Scatolibacter rhodanostii]
MLNKNIETFMACDKEYDEATTVLFGTPFDSTTSYRPGTRFGPSTIRAQSYGIETYSPYQDLDLEDIAVMDSGDIELCIGDTQKVLKQIEDRTAQILADGKRPFMIGGEHLVTLGAFRAIHEQYPEVHIVHFDAHADLREDYLGVKLSHACVLRRCWEFTGDNRIFQFGIRSGDKEEFLWGKEHVSTNRFNLDTLEETLERLKDKPIYFTVDLDILDPSIFPGTGTPEPGGVSFEELRKAVTLVCQQANIVGCDVNELSPHYDQSGVSAIVACKIIREMLLALRA